MGSRELERTLMKQSAGQGSTPEQHSGFLLASLLLFLLLPSHLKPLPVNISDRFATLPTLRSRISG